ncbi:MAG: UDP-N-acetylmuramate dehydrogenase [Gammaproteobacteria bacterium]
MAEELDICLDFPLHDLLALQLPVTARFYVRVTQVSQLLAALKWARRQGHPFLVLGNGTNMVLRDCFAGLVIHMDIRGVQHWPGPDANSMLIQVAAGENWPDLVAHSVQCGWYGLENLSSIPGSVGAAPISNIGAYGVELAQVLESVEVLDTERLERTTLRTQDCDLSYRRSRFSQAAQSTFRNGRLLAAAVSVKWIILAIRLRLSTVPCMNLSHAGLKLAVRHRKLDPKLLNPAQVAGLVTEIRQQKLPSVSECPNVGSFFLNPRIPAEQHRELQARFPNLVSRRIGQGYELSAAWLIEQSGWKGKAVQAAKVSAQHALILVNRGGDGQAIVDLALAIAADIQKTYGIDLQPEPAIY